MVAKSKNNRSVVVSVLILLFLPIATMLITGISSVKDEKKADAVITTKNGVGFDYEYIPIAYQTKIINDPNLEIGKTAVKTHGKNGEKLIEYKVTYTIDDVELREKIGEEITQQPVDEVIAKGTKNVWRCKNATSYDKNSNNDNYCWDSYGNGRYVSDLVACSLDSSYHPSQAGNSYYNTACNR